MGSCGSQEPGTLTKGQHSESPQHETRDYRCFISVSVIAGDTAYGMLTLDAIEPGALTVEDKGLLRLMAGLLAIALSES